MKKILELLFHRVAFVALLMLIQIGFFLLMFVYFEQYVVYYYAVSVFFSMILVIYIVSSSMNPAYKIAWLIPILVVPVFGIFMFLIFGNSSLKKHEIEQLTAISSSIKKAAPHRQIADSELRMRNPGAAQQSKYILDYSRWPLYQNTAAEYFPLGEAKFERMKEELAKAQKYIFLEYFIIQPGIMWNSILEILEAKAKDGLDVRVMYDDLGSSFTLPPGYASSLKQKGIKCCNFNPFIPVLTARFNNRDHQKICVVDGHTAFTGGINLADEYINAYEKHGHWKDTAIMLKGDGAWSLTMMFLEVWDFSNKIQEDYFKYRPDPLSCPPVADNGYVQPFNDSPLDNESVGETVYLNLIAKATSYVWIFTPYLIITSEMERALCSAAKSGIDVRIVTPHIADKWYVHMVTRDYYKELLKAGVKIYEYTPGFIHAKTFLVDDEYGVVGTINLDFRSLYLHFECGVWMYKTDCLTQMKEDYLNTLAVSQEISLESVLNISRFQRFLRKVLRLFAPLL